MEVQWTIARHKGMHDEAYGAAFQPASACSDACQGRTMKNQKYCQLGIMHAATECIITETVYETNEEVHNGHATRDQQMQEHYS